ncbi:ABC transporter permease [Heyndrickxia oleronia]|uniref:ABC transporter permease n=1 Tax=Heyndrickxia oleronia TaxID=38875 RepID=UPI00071740CB|nr:ABC transporter permease [Heyndrickxia oleronia]MBU5211844.1 ABC transporter permease [Heyndrickxia oleronia]MCM3456941.1 ABC transporter permease [Heyndrickxia oleronia]NYV66782.1 ABC transporter permease [Bacillus sp. Gen3]OJH17576.1 ABC transporter [Bacillus obstructivus]
MKQIENLWKERVQLHTVELRKYLKYIFNDHLLFVAIFALGAGAFYYNGWVKTLDESFPVAWVMGIILGLFLTMSPIYTFLKEADKVYLLPIEMKLKFYFRKAIHVSFMLQSYILLMILAACMPMYAKVTGNGFKSFFLILLILLIVKLWNLYLQWDVLKIQDYRISYIDWLVRFVVNCSFIYFIIERSLPWIYGLYILIFLGLYFIYHQATKEKTLKWDTLINKEEKRMSAFYRFANLFTDVPKLRGQVKRRKWLDPLLNFVQYDQKNTYSYLFIRTFMRTSEYFGLFIRLLLIGGFLLYFSDQFYLVLGISIIFLYLTGFQLIPMIRFHELKIWQFLYPVQRSFKEKSFIKLLHVILLVQSVIFGVIVLISNKWESGLIVLIVNIVFSLGFVKWFVPSRIKKINKGTIF